MRIAVDASYSDLIQLLISNGADIHAEDWDPAVRAELAFLSRRPLLFFFKAVSVSEDRTISRSFRGLTQNPDLVIEIVTFL